MKKKSLSSVLSVATLISLTSMTVVLQDNGIAGYTNSPGEGNCTTCHNSFSANTGGGSITITATPSLTNNEFLPNTDYTITATVSKTGHLLFGFGTEILNSSNTNAGTLSIINSSSTQLKSSGGRTNVVHQLGGGASSNSMDFSFKWTSPASGSATIYASGLATNNNGSTNGDYVYTTSLSLTASTATSIKKDDIGFDMLVYSNANFIDIGYTLSKSSVVKINLIDLSGKIVADLLNEHQANGIQKHQFKIPESVAKGLYLITLNVNNQLVTKRIIIE